MNAADQPPNILYVVADDMGWADVGFHGSKIKTANIDRLCAEGVELTDSNVWPEPESSTWPSAPPIPVPRNRVGTP